jgi:cathepsin B
MIREINSRNDVTWTAGMNSMFQDMDLKTFRSMNAARPNPPESKVYITHNMSNIEIPELFDARDKWPECKSIGKIYDQGHCGSCWAMCTFEVLQDRICIHSDGKKRPELSAQYLTSCDTGSYGCQGFD